MERTSTRRYADAALAAVVLLVVGMMIVPLPTPLLDVLITANMSVGVLLLLVALYVPDGLSFTSFPTLLLITTLYRLALNVSSTRLILLQADAGEVITAFGGFVVRGNYVVGAVIFLILTLIQFLVIAKGSERVAEVGARFTLDAMPGKQMAIDAELRTGAIGQDEARRRRRTLHRESQFYGAMDGAMKFVKGDAIAGIVITVVNIVGGLAIGVLMRDMTAVQSLRVYGLLTIGDGLVSQIPSLLISTAAGLVVTRVASEDEDSSLGGEVGRQIFGNPRALGIAAVFLVILGVIPGLPTVPFFVLALVFGGLAWRLMRRAPTAEGEGDAALRPEAQREQRAKKQLVPLVVPISVELGPELAAELLDARGGGPLLEDEIPRVRESLFLALGIPVPGVRARSAPIGPREYVIALQEIPVSRGDAPTGLFVPSAPSALASFGVSGVAHLDPQTQREGSIASLESRAVLEAAGLPALTATQLVGRHLEEIVRRRGHELVGLQETQAMLDQLERAYPALVRNVVPKPVGLPLLADILRRLVEEGVSIRPLREILEALAIHAAVEKDPVALTEAVRAALRRPITHRHVRSGAVAVHLLDPLLEDTVRDAIQRTATGSYLALPPDLARDIVAAVSRALTSATHPVLLTQSDVRRFVRRLLENELPEVVVLSYQELDPAVTVQPLGRIGLKG
ncbi:MAG: type III secretion system export apparatus subunit SctV [Deltaproteobacteria bacterium]|nr:type III secretion system export apparatus subunit SctV [Deltaproteobacteria bacterium]